MCIYAHLLHSLSLSLSIYLSFHVPPPSPSSSPGDDGSVGPPGLPGGGEAEAAAPGTEAVPGKPVAEGRAGRGPAEAAGQGAGGGHAGGAEQTPAVHEQYPQVRPGVAITGRSQTTTTRVVFIIHQTGKKQTDTVRNYQNCSYSFSIAQCFAMVYPNEYDPVHVFASAFMLLLKLSCWWLIRAGCYVFLCIVHS